MFLSPAIVRHPEFRKGMVATASLGMGVAAWGLMTGVAISNSGMSLLECVAMVLLVYAGTAQLAALPLIVAGAPGWVILATTLCVNLRFVVFSLHLRPYLMHLPRWRRLVHGTLTGDSTYAIFIHKFPVPATDEEGRTAQEAYMVGNYGLIWLCWTPTSLAGIFLGNLIPPAWGLGFAGTLCLMGMLCSMANTRRRGVAAGVGAVAAVAAYALPLKLNIVTAIAAAVLLSLWLEERASQGRGTAHGGGG